MASFFESESEEEESIGFVQERESPRNTSDLESDITVSSVNTEDLSDFSVSNSESGEEGDEEWNSNPDPVVVTPFEANTGPVSDLTGYSAYDCFKLMFKEENFHRIAEETKRYARQSMETKPDRTWRETDAEELCAYFALNILFGIKQLPEVYSYWSKNPLLGVPEVQKIFPRNRYAKISRYLHVNDKRKELPRGHANHDKLFKVRPLLDSVVDAIKSEYRPTKNVAVDEAMIPFKGRLSLKQYMPLKPVKRGIKVWECADSSNGFVCDLNVYTGKQRDGNPEQGLGYRVVHNLTRTLVGKNHHVFVDNFFNSVNLAKDLLQDKIYICGTVRSNRQGIPRELGPSTQRVKQLRQGESLFLRKGNLVATVWKDKKPVYFLSTQSNPVGNETVSRRQRDGTVIEVPSAPVVKSYNNNMGGVDLSDQLRGYYMTGRKSKKWWRCLLWFLVDVSIVNADILEKVSQRNGSRTQLAFRLELVQALLGNFSARRLSVSSGRLEGGHWPISFSKGRCKRCLKNKKLTFCRMGCELCNKHICLACFKNHTAEDLA